MFGLDDSSFYRLQLVSHNYIAAVEIVLDLVSELIVPEYYWFQLMGTL